MCSIMGTDERGVLMTDTQKSTEHCDRCDSLIPDDEGCVKTPTGVFWCYSCLGIWVITLYKSSAVMIGFKPHYFDISRGWTPEGGGPGNTHLKDEDCKGFVVDGCCSICGVGHGDPCEECGGSAYHRDGCAQSDTYHE